MHKARKEHYQKDKKIQQSFDHCVLKSRKLAQHTKKVDCPVALSIKKILTFRLFKIEKDNKRRRTEAAKKIKSYLEEMKQLNKAVKNEEFKSKLQYLRQFPYPSAHQNHHTGQAAGISEPLDNWVVEYLKKQIREGCRRTKDLQRRAKLFVDQTILLEQDPTIFRHRFRPTRKKIKNLITAVKVEARFVYFYGSNWQDIFYKLIACGTRSRCPIWIFFWYFKNLKFPSCLGKGAKILQRYTVLFIPRACFPKYALTRMAVAEPHFKEIF